MNRSRPYPDEVSGPFPSPPRSFTDTEGREIRLRAYGERDDPAGAGVRGRGTGEDARNREFEALVEMYADFDPADRAQGIPPVGEERIRSWLDVLLDGHNVVAWDGDRAVGHATLVPDEDAYELAIFVHQDYQGAGIGTRLIRTLLGHGRDRGVEKVWLTVERWNNAAVALYRKVGFETCDAESFELEMAIRLDGDE